MKIAKEYEFRIPTFLLSALVNGDLSGLDEDDEKTYRRMIAKFEELANGLPYTTSGWEDSDSTKYFSYQPDFCSLGCEVVDITLNIFCDHTTATCNTELLEVKNHKYVKVVVTEVCDKCLEVISKQLDTYEFSETEELE